ncbi:MAG TPA: hypothetical protein VIT42_02805 [Microlunatus sp.]
MSAQPPEAESSEFTAAIGKVARRELALHGLTRYDQLSEFTAAEVLRIHGVGPKAVRLLDAELTARGLAFRR